MYFNNNNNNNNNNFIANVKQWGHRLYAFMCAKGGNL